MRNFRGRMWGAVLKDPRGLQCAAHTEYLPDMITPMTQSKEFLPPKKQLYKIFILLVGYNKVSSFSCPNLV
jgi:hypothetical protein